MRLTLIALTALLAASLPLRAQQNQPQLPPTNSGGIGLSQAVIDSLESPRTPPPRTTKVKGPFLRTELRSRDTAYRIEAELSVDTPYRQPTLKVKRFKDETITEVRIYETLLRTFIPGEDNNRGTYEYESLPSETWEGETNSRVVTSYDGAFANEKVKLNGFELVTDSDGLVSDPENKVDLLGKFDELGNRNASLDLEIDGYDPVHVNVTRTMPMRRQSDEKRIEEDEKNEILLLYGLDFNLTRRKPEQDALECKAFLPMDFAFAEAGKFFPLTIQVKNDGTAQTSCLIARTFSRVRGLYGKLFYFGGVKPGQTVSFTRLVRVEEEELAAKASLEIRFSDSWSVPKHRIPLTFPVVH